MLTKQQLCLVNTITTCHLKRKIFLKILQHRKTFRYNKHILQTAPSSPFKKKKKKQNYKKQEMKFALLWKDKKRRKSEVSLKCKWMCVCILTCSYIVYSHNKPLLSLLFFSNMSNTEYLARLLQMTLGRSCFFFFQPKWKRGRLFIYRFRVEVSWSLTYWFFAVVATLK